ncbi:MAG: hypothetical protein QOJ32_2447, partial [Frankiaceae bacterium]|nr:hypothetical protein [Frankiaceae bacterium]
LADELKVSQNTVLRTWRHYRVQPWRSETFKFSTDPELVAKVHDVVGLYLAPPEDAVVTLPHAGSPSAIYSDFADEIGEGSIVELRGVTPGPTGSASRPRRAWAATSRSRLVPEQENRAEVALA